MIDLRPDFLDTLKRLLAEIVPDCEVRIFGSRYNWTATDASDLDLALVGPSKLHWKTLTRLKAALEESSLPYRVDVLDWRAISPEFQKVIEQGYEVIQKLELAMSPKIWQKLTLGEISKDVSYGYTASAQSEPVGPKFLRITDIVGGLNWDTVPYCEIAAREYKKCKLEIGDIVIARTGATTGTAEIIKEDKKAVFASYLIRFRIDETKAAPFFVGHVLKSDNWKEFIKSVVGGSAQPGANATVLSQYEITLPPITIQHRIADILSALNEKIEINRQTNATLETIAQAIFKEWFVDFNFPGTTGEMVESELGMIPKGWTVGKIKDFSKRIQYGLTQSASTMEIGPHFLRITDIQNGQINWADVPYCVVDEKDTEKYKIDNYDIFIARTGASTGENVLAINPPDAVFASYLIRVQFTKPQLAVYVGKLLRSRQYFEFIDSIKSGSAQPNANAQQLTDFDIVLPMLDILGNYFRIVADIENMKAEYQAQSATLATIRDALLPELMSGEIEV